MAQQQEGLTHIRARQIEHEIRKLGAEAGLTVIIHSPLLTAQAQASQAWRTLVDLRSSLRAAYNSKFQSQIAETLIMTDIMIDGTLKLLNDIERILYPGEDLDMQEREPEEAHPPLPR